MAKVWRYITAFKNATGNILFLLLLVVVIVSLLSSDEPTVPDNAVLILNPSGNLVEQRSTLPPFFFAGDRRSSETLLRDVTDGLRLAAEDERIKAVALELDYLAGGSLSQLEEIAASLAAFQATGKQVLSFGRGYSQAQYYLASQADQVYLDEGSHGVFDGIFFTGVGIYPLYYKSALDKLHINTHVFKAGDYKDAAESWLRDDMSESSKEANSAFLNTFWDGYVQTVAARRNLGPDELNYYIENYETLLDAADLEPGLLAKQQGLVDDLISWQGWQEALARVTGSEGDDYNAVTLTEYVAAARPTPSLLEQQVAVLVIEGVIMDQEFGPGSVDAEAVVELIRQAKEDPSIASLVVRVDSPGGSASASEYIRRELQLVRESGKPVVVSMGGIAASGGYWISAPADQIFASSSTLTGSIGVFMMAATLETAFDKLGIHSDGVGTTSMSDAFNSLRPLNPKLGAVLEKSIERTYGKFLAIVAEGRGISVEEVDKVAQGRIWAGITAMDLGLVDALGNTSDAIASAAAAASLDEYEVTYLEEHLSPGEMFVARLSESLSVMLPLPVSFLTGVALPEVPVVLRPYLNGQQMPSTLSQCDLCRVVF